MTAYRSFELGPLQRRFASPLPVRPLLIFFVIFGLPGLALVTGFQSGKGEVFAGDRTTNGLLGAGLLVFAAYLMALVVRKGTLAVAVHENGFVWREGGRARTVPWTDVVSMRDSHTKRTVVGAEVARTNVYRLRLASGNELVATSMLSDVHDFGAHVASVLERRLPELRDALEKGRTLEFGELVLRADAVEHRQRRLSRSSIASVEISNGEIEIKPHTGDAIAVDWRETPNARLLVALLTQVDGNEPS